jgi:hypothetical protein
MEAIDLRLDAFCVCWGIGGDKKADGDGIVMLSIVGRLQTIDALKGDGSWRHIERMVICAWLMVQRGSHRPCASVL